MGMTDADNVYRVMLRRALSSGDAANLQVHFEVSVLDRYRGVSGYSIIRTNSVGRVRKEGGWSLDHPSLNSVGGPTEAAEAFADAWIARHGGTWKTRFRMRLHELTRVSYAGPVPAGSLRKATKADLALAREWADDYVRDYLRDLGLPESVLSSFPHQLSGGMRQRVTIALATILAPRLILADEPTTALDVVVQRGVIQLLDEIRQRTGSTLVLVTHDMGVHANLADRVAVVYAGHIVEQADTTTVVEPDMSVWIDGRSNMQIEVRS